MTALILALFLCPQDDISSAIDKLIEKLDDDQLDVREKATHDLIALGPRALETLRKREATAGSESRARLAIAIREIERAERLKLCMGVPSRVTLKADRMPLKDVIAELKKRTLTRIELKGIAETEAVTVELKDALFFEAVDKICLAHGGIRARAASDNRLTDEGIVIEKGDPRAVRRHVEEQFFVEFGGVSISEGSDFRGHREESMTLLFAFGGDGAFHPIGATFAVDSLICEDGSSWAVEEPHGLLRDDFMFPPNREIYVPLKKLPEASMKSFREISGTLELIFPEDIHVARIEKPDQKKDVGARCGPVSITLREFVKDGDRYIATLDEEGKFRGDEPWTDRVRFEVLDQNGLVHGNTGGRGHSTNQGPMHWTYHFELPEGARPVELRATKMKIAGAHLVKRTIKWTLKDVRFR